MKPENLIQSHRITQKCTTGCPILDRFLAGGLSCNSLTELVGESSSGKTQICLQLLISAQLPISLGGLSAASLYLCSELPFPFRRLQQLSVSFRSAYPQVFSSYDPCDNIFVEAVHSADHLFDNLLKFDSLISKNSSAQFPVKVIIIDSIAALFRSEFDNTPSDLKRRSSLFFKISSKLKYLANRYDLAVVITNQVVDYVASSDGMNGLRIGNLGCLYSSGRRICPALGLSWANCVNSRLFLARNDEIIDHRDGFEQRSRTRRHLYIIFSPYLPESSCEFAVLREGVSGVQATSCQI
ncbi:DNA repair protein XRCC3 homolog [Impatiens glandulifera]|uniref:DNA repair protein XRCC3 homolog n=1 Tax=Impatiens glandulifera TaxID=253017 RepID=UPI001FB06A25|nr:DNA repair protein XRCC3 homolog [Impatiens glandulifera]